MPRKGKKNDDERSTPKHPEKLFGWINCRIEDSDTPELEQLLESENDLAGELVAFVERGYSVGVKWQSDGKSVMAYIIGTCDDDKSGSVGLSAFGSDAFSAIASLVYKYHVKLNQRLGRPDESKARRFG